jgi:hypothetical protein
MRSPYGKLVRNGRTVMVERSFLMLLGSLALIQSAHAQTIVKQEPPEGGIRRGEIVWVDNGQCPWSAPLQPDRPTAND